MAVNRNATVDLSGFEDAVEWLKARKNTFVGLVVVGALVIAATYFIRHQIKQSAVRPWMPLFGGAREPWDMDSKELSVFASDATIEQEVAAYANWWLALRRAEDEDLAGAIDGFDSFRARFPVHSLCRPFGHQPLTAAESAAAESICDRTKSDVSRLSAWVKAHPMPIANPPSSRKQTVTLVTERGPIVLALYSDLAPKSCEDFKKIALSFKDQFIAKASPDNWLEIGQTESGTALETKDLGESFPPFEINRLSHVAGAVAFRQAPFTKGPFNTDIRVYLAPSYSEDDRSTVFAEVAEGLPLLSALAKEELKADAPQLLAHPLKVTDVKFSDSP